MVRRQAFKFEIIPSGQQIRHLRRIAGCCRYVFNMALALQRALYNQGESRLGYARLCKLLTEWRHSEETSWLSQSPVHPLQQSLRDLDRAYSNFLAGRTRPPRFKRKGQGDRFRFPDPRQIKLDQPNSRIYLPTIGWLRYRNSREVLGSLRNVTVGEICGKWYVSIQTEREVSIPHHRGGEIGLDVGIARFCTMSDGTFFPPLHSFKRHEASLRKAQQALSRKTKYSRNWKKAKTRVQRIHARIANARKDFLHKCSTAISKNHAIVYIEDLKVRSMSRSAAGTSRQPGRGVKKKSRLNKSIMDQGWAEFRKMLDYKLTWNGGRLIHVAPHNTSRTCPNCHYAAKENRTTQAKFECRKCGFKENADVVAAMNILSAGHARLACEVSGYNMPPAAGTHRSTFETG